ncbi:MAG: hypothetical protein V3U80_00025 [Flavobacteriaceae bacterium]
MDLTALVSIVGGIIAAAAFIVSKKPDAKEYIDKIAPYQGIIGIVLLIWSVRNGLSFFSHFSLNGLIISGLQFVVGFLLAYSLLSQYLFSKSDEAKEKGQLVRQKLVQYQVPAGLALIVAGALRLFGLFN